MSSESATALCAARPTLRFILGFLIVNLLACDPGFPLRVSNEEYVKSSETIEQLYEGHQDGLLIRIGGSTIGSRRMTFYYHFWLEIQNLDYDTVRFDPFGIQLYSHRGKKLPIRTLFNGTSDPKNEGLLVKGRGISIPQDSTCIVRFTKDYEEDVSDRKVFLLVVDGIVDLAYGREIQVDTIRMTH